MAPGARVRFSGGACLSVRYPGSGCIRCISACPITALNMVGDAPTLNGECIGCGQCSAACPTDALQVDGFVPPSAHFSGGSEIYIDCWRVPVAESPAGALRVPCLGGLSAGSLLTIFDLSDERPLHLLDRGACGDCPAGKGIPGLLASLTEARMMLFESGVGMDSLPAMTFHPAGRALAPSIPSSETETAIDRRSFFRGLLGGVMRAADEIADAASPNSMAISLRDKAMPVERMRLTTSLRRIAMRHGRDVPARAMPKLSVSGCDAHGVCAGVCPVGAIDRIEEGGSAGLRFNADLCIACGECVRRCPEQAIQIASSGGSAMTEVLVTWAARKCTECGEEFFGAADERCPVCIKKVSLQQGMAVAFQPSA